MIDNQQLKAVELDNCRALLLAGPGCGKTHILARRIFHANTVCGVAFENMLCLTFTNRAAREMSRRVHDYLGTAPRGLFIGNIHSFCFRFLHANRLVSPDTSVIDEEDVAEYLANVHGIRDSRGIKEFLDKAAYAYQLEHDHPDRVIRRPWNHPTEEDYERIEAYSKFKEDNQLIDYDDILLMSYTALLDNKADSLKMTGFTWLQVDEVQDMTPLQLAIIDGLCSRGRRTALYLGDEQQAIFGFLGAGGRALDAVRSECGSNILRLQRNYRSPDYLVKLCNHLAGRYLGIDPDFLPKAVFRGETPRPLLTWSGDAGTLLLMAAAQARRLLRENPEQTTAILVHTNRQGQEMADLLADHGFDFFHVSRPDIFHQTSFKTIWSHLAVVQRPTRYQEWARLLYQTRAVRTLSGSRQLMNLLRDASMSGDELLSIDSPTAIERFADAMSYEDMTIAVLDTETTGLDVFHDDVIQIAAIKIRGGKEVAGSRFCVFIRTERQIPRFLSDGADNPMREAYAAAELLEAEEGLSRFAVFLSDCSIIAGHNLAYDRAILRHNYERRCSGPVPDLLSDKKGLDTLQIAQLLMPKHRSHKLADLIETLGFEGENSHNALDDVAATVGLMNALKPMARLKTGRQAKIRSNSNVRKAARRFTAAYEPLYSATGAKMEEDSGSLTEALTEAKNYFSGRGYTGPIRHFGYFLEMIDKLIVNKDSEANLKSQAEAHLADLTSYNESDLLANGIVTERLSVMTVHKAKGLEMDNVILLDAASRPAGSKDYARLLYVAFSRAKERLYAGRSPWEKNAMLSELLGSFEELPKEEVALAVREERTRHFFTTG